MTAKPLDPRASYPTYDELTAYVRQLAADFPEVVRLRSLGTTPQGRQLWLLAIGQDPDRRRPAVWIDGNMHACELAGSSVALALAHGLATLIAGNDGAKPAALGDLPAPLLASAKTALFYILPRMSPDGAEAVLSTGRFVRSLPRDDRGPHATPRWRYQDVDGDGQALAMRVRDPAGEFVEHPECVGLMVQRGLGDAGPYYKIYPEGVIEHFDGHAVPAFSFMDDNPVDLNRNFPAGWAPTHKQVGAGAFSTSEPESRAVVEFAVAHPEIFMWLNYHCFGGVFIRPLGDASDDKMNQADLAIFRQLGQWAEALTSYPMVSGYQEFLYEPDKPLRGDLSDFAYEARGAFSFAIELWDLFARLGIPRPKRFVEYYDQLTRDHAAALYRWDRAHNGGRAFPPWRRCNHPQLGEVEVGGSDPRHTVWNPPPAQLAEMCDQQLRMVVHVAAMAPRLELEHKLTDAGGMCRLDVVVRNTGYLPTFVLQGAKELDIAQPLSVEIHFAAEAGFALVDAGQAHQPIGHLAGWGRGFDGAANGPAYMQSEGNATERRVTFWLRETSHRDGRSGRNGSAPQAITVRAGGLRTGWVELTV